MRKVYRKQFSNWSDPVQKQLREYNFGQWDGQMYGQIAHDPDTFVMLDRGEVIGWALINNDWAMFYVRPEYRREGVGRRLADRIRKHYTPRVDPWDDASQGFFDSTGMSKQRSYYADF